MNALTKMQDAGFNLTLKENGNIQISPFSKLTKEQRQFIKAHKPQIISCIKDDSLIEIQEEIQEHVEERAAIMEFDGGLSRPEAEEAAKRAVKVYRYKVTDKPDSTLTAIMPNTTLKEAEKILSNRYGNRLLMITAYVPCSNGLRGNDNG